MVPGPALGSPPGRGVTATRPGGINPGMNMPEPLARGMHKRAGVRGTGGLVPGRHGWSSRRAAAMDSAVAPGSCLSRCGQRGRTRRLAAASGTARGGAFLPALGVGPPHQSQGPRQHRGGTLCLGAGPCVSRDPRPGSRNLFLRRSSAADRPVSGTGHERAVVPVRRRAHAEACAW